MKTRTTATRLDQLIDRALGTETPPVPAAADQQIDLALGTTSNAPAVPEAAAGPDATAVPETPPPLDTSLPRVHGKLSYDQIALIVSMNAAGEPTQAIADYFHIRRETVWRILQKFADTSAEAKARLKMSAGRLAEAAILAADRGAQRGDGSVALELLDRLDVAPKRMASQTGASGVQVMVIVGGHQGQADPSALPSFSDSEPRCQADVIDAELPDALLPEQAE